MSMAVYTLKLPPGDRMHHDAFATDDSHLVKNGPPPVDFNTLPEPLRGAIRAHELLRERIKGMRAGDLEAGSPLPDGFEETTWIAWLEPDEIELLLYTELVGKTIHVSFDVEYGMPKDMKKTLPSKTKKQALVAAEEAGIRVRPGYRHHCDLSFLQTLIWQAADRRMLMSALKAPERVQEVPVDDTGPDDTDLDDPIQYAAMMMEKMSSIKDSLLIAADPTQGAKRPVCHPRKGCSYANKWGVELRKCTVRGVVLVEDNGSKRKSKVHYVTPGAREVQQVSVERFERWAKVEITEIVG